MNVMYPALNLRDCADTPAIPPDQTRPAPPVFVLAGAWGKLPIDAMNSVSTLGALQRGLRRLRALFLPRPETFMASIIDRRVTARIQGDFVVFLIGMRINNPWKPHKWLLNVRTMPKMLKELEAAPAAHGFLGYTNLRISSLVQYWRSFDHLEA